jgi:hypothetical protein
MEGIRYLERKDIDESKWDACISNAPNQHIYGYAAYLDAMADNWGALIIHDYEAVLPLPWKKKFGISYLYTPRYTSPLAVYGHIPESIGLKQLLNHVPQKFRLWDMNLSNDLSFFSASAVKRKNHLLHLLPPYDQLRKNYRASYRNLLNQAEEAGQQASKEISIDTIIQLAAGKKNIEGTSSDDYYRFRSVYTHMEKKGEAVCYGNYSPDKNLLAAAVFFISHNRIYYMLAWNNEEGRKKGASHQLIDTVIQEKAGKNTWLDFEGSDIPGIAFFFEGFGAQPEEYYYLRVNRLPWWCRWMKE